MAPRAATAGTGDEGTGAEGAGGRVRLTVADNGTGVTLPAGAAQTGTGIGGTGLKGLTERLAAAGGSLSAGPIPRGGFLMTAGLPGLPDMANLHDLHDLAAETPSPASSPASSSSPSSSLSPSPSQVKPHIRPTLTP